MGDIVPIETGNSLVTPDEILGKAHGIAREVSFVALHHLSIAAGLGRWMDEHRTDADGFTRRLAESFRTPFPSGDVSDWRDASGYQYLDEYPASGSLAAVELTEPGPSVYSPDGHGVDTGFRLLVAVPKKGKKKISDDDLAHPRIGLQLRIGPEAKQSPSTMTGRLGEGQIDDNGKPLHTRPLQELLLVGARFACLLVQAGQERTQELPAMRNRSRQRFLRELTR